MRILVVLILLISFSLSANINIHIHLGEKKKKDISSDFDAIIRSSGIRRSKLISEVVKKYPHKKIVYKIINLLNSDDLLKVIAAVEMTGIIKDKRYRSYIKKLMKIQDSPELIDNIIFSIGANKYNSLAKGICKYITVKNLSRTVSNALMMLKKGTCKKEIKKIIFKKNKDDVQLALEIILNLGDSRYKKQLIRMLKDKEFYLDTKLFIAFALLSINDINGEKYIKNYIKKIDDKYDLFLFFQKFTRTFKKSNKSITNIYEYMLKSKYLKIRLMAAIELAKSFKKDLIPKNDIDYYLKMEHDDENILKLMIRFNTYYKRNPKPILKKKYRK